MGRRRDQHTEFFDEVTNVLHRSKSIKNKWNEIAKELFFNSGKRFFRTSKQCR